MSSRNAVIIGAGISGLLSALVLSKEGYSVTIVEKEKHIGGACRSYNVDGYCVDSGPHIITRLEDGPLKRLIDDYFDTVPVFEKHGEYYIRTQSRITPFPWTLKAFSMFDIIPKLDRIELVQIMLGVYYQRAIGRFDPNLSVRDVIYGRDLDPRTEQFLDVLCKFMCGAGMEKTPVARFFDSQDYKNKKESPDPLKYVNGMKNLISKKGAQDQMYPRGGIQSLINSICSSFESAHVSIYKGCEAQRVDVVDGRVTGVVTKNGTFPADIVIYSSFASRLPELVESLPYKYKSELSRLESVVSLTMWLGLDKIIFTRRGSEVWVDSDVPLWVVPTSLFDKSLAPPGHQVVGFTTTIDPGADIENEKKRLFDTVCARLRNIGPHIQMRHFQVLIPEKAAWVVNQEMPSCQTPVEGLYLVGTDTTTKSMGVTRSAYSVHNLLDALRKDGLL